MFIFGMLIGIIIGAAFPDQIGEILSIIAQGIIVVFMFVPFCFYYSFRFVFNPADPQKWEENKHYFKYKELFKGFYICYEARASKPWKLIFFLRIKKSS